LQLRKLQLKNFRCFNTLDLDLNSNLVLIQGDNGSGKTSILEALSYLCFLKSFRTHVTKELIHEQNQSFFIKAEFESPEYNEIQVGFSGKKRVVKINGKLIQSYKELMVYYRTITLTEDDLDLIKGSPEIRRSFIDQHILLNNPQSLHLFRKYKQILENRNALLFKGRYQYEDYTLWTEALWQQAKLIQKIRIDSLLQIEAELNNLILQNFPELKVKFQYEAKLHLQQEHFSDFIGQNPNLLINEEYQKRSLFGTHLDDFSIIFSDRKTKIFASRGQQKLLVLLTKVAQIKLLCQLGYQDSITFLLDDFMTDFDSKKIESLVNMLCCLGIQLIFTCPTVDSKLKSLLTQKNVLIIHLNESPI